jgi:hypothetical protein
MNRIICIVFFLPILLVSQTKPICFQRPDSVPSPAVGYLPIAFCSADFNSDGNKDLIVVNTGSNHISMVLGDGDGNFNTIYNFLSWIVPLSICTADFNGDGKADVAFSGSALQVYLGIGNTIGSFSIGPVYQVDPSAFSIVAADFNLDGIQDIATTSLDSSNISIMMGTGNGSFASPVEYAIGPKPRALCTGDFNNDGRIDLAAVNNDPGFKRVSVLFNNGFGAFLPAISNTVNVLPFSLASADFNNDGFQDIAVGGLSAIELLIYSGANSFSAGNGFLPGGSGPVDITIQDFNNDGNSDIAVCNYSTNNTCVFAGLGNGTFSSPIALTVNNSPVKILTGDFNSDNKYDLAVANLNSDNLSIFLNGPILKITAPQVLCSSDIATISVSGAETYTWSNGINGNTYTIQPTDAMTLIVTGTQSLGCVNSNTLLLNVVPCTNIWEGAQDLTISIFPNPTSGETFVTIEQSEGTQLEVTDPVGRSIIKMQIPMATNKIDLREQTPGVYFVKIISEQGMVVSKKILKVN